MVYLRIKEKTKEARLLLEYLRTMPYIEILEGDDKIKTPKISRKEFISDLKNSFKEVKNKKTKPLKDLLDAK